MDCIGDDERGLPHDDRKITDGSRAARSFQCTKNSFGISVGHERNSHELDRE